MNRRQTEATDRILTACTNYRTGVITRYKMYAQVWAEVDSRNVTLRHAVETLVDSGTVVNEAVARMRRSDYLNMRTR